jgi:hypothetical protein
MFILESVFRTDYAVSSVPQLDNPSNRLSFREKPLQDVVDVPFVAAEKTTPLLFRAQQMGLVLVPIKGKSPCGGLDRFQLWNLLRNRRPEFGELPG